MDNIKLKKYNFVDYRSTSSIFFLLFFCLFWSGFSTFYYVQIPTQWATDTSDLSGGPKLASTHPKIKLSV